MNCQWKRRVSMSVLIRRYKGNNGVMQEERIDEDDRIERYMRLFEKDDIKKLQTGVKVFIEKDEWQLLP
jgi:hypothetical protein